jgi:hypothetical protein
MRRLSTLVAALATVFTVGAANAVVVIVDDFNAPDLTLFDTIGGDSIAATANQSPVRTVSHELITATGNGGLQSSVLIGNVAFPAGVLQMSNANSIDSQVKVNWTLAVGAVPTTLPVFFFFDVVESDAVQKTIGFSLDGGATTFASYSIGAATNTPLLFGVNAMQQAALNAGGTLTMIVDGGNGWDLSLDSFGFSIPEPTSLALVGLALLGAGVASRRRQA